MSVGASTTPERPRRAMCARCERPVSVCYCAALTTIETRSKIVILQHPREHGMPIGTAHMATLCLPQASLHVGLAWDGSEVLERACADPERPAVLLYPGPEARDILQDPPPAPVTLIVVDGTWSQARKLVRGNPQLAALPRYAFHAPEPSHYRIRREPRAEYVSTLEALMHVLGAIEGNAERFRALRRPMNVMIDAQIRAHEAARTSTPKRRVLRPRVRLTPQERLPAEIWERYDDLVLVVGDANAWPWGTPHRRYGDELVHWVAHRPRSGETFAYVLAPRNPLAPDIPTHTGLPAATLRGGGAVAEFLEAYAAFTRPDDVICSWGHHGLRMFQDCGGPPPTTFLDMQRAARSLANTKVGSIERYAVDAAAASAAAPSAEGRAGRRLGMLISTLETWRALGCEPTSAP